jgi:predicted nuclease of predicted toxin-antitoxin system
VRVLLDEMLDRRLKRLLPEGVEAVTVRERGWGSKKNGELLALAEKEFDVLLTTDRGIPHQQDLSRFDLEVVVLSARSNRLADLEPRMEEVGRLIEELDRNR